MQIKIPEGANRILRQLNMHGYEAYVVGGCVRDSILKKEPTDWDITTSASPLVVKSLFKRTIDTGIQHGTVTVMDGKTGYEVTTYRLDGTYEDHRRPAEVIYTASLQEDLKRRDFTINAMAYNETDGLVDLYGGVEDLKNGFVRCVGSPEDRFDEDALRMLRAVRFSAQLGFQIEEATKAAVQKKCSYLKDISAERIQVELTKLIISDYPDRLILASELGITKVVLPEFDQMLKTQQNNPYHLYNVGVHTVKAMEKIDSTPILRWTMLLHDVGKTVTQTTDDNGIDHFYGHAKQSEVIGKKILKRMKLDNYTIKTVIQLVKWHDYNWGTAPGKKSIRKAANKIGPEIFSLLIKVQKADAGAHSSLEQREKLALLEHILELYQEILADDECLTLKDLKINGKQLIELGVPPGKQMGELLNDLLSIVLEDPDKNTFEELKHIVLEQLNL